MIGAELPINHLPLGLGRLPGGGNLRPIEARYDDLIERLRAAARPDRIVPPVAEGYLRKVRGGAYTVTDRDISDLRAAGLSEDEIFELTVSAAVGVGLDHLSAGLRALA